MLVTKTLQSLLRMLHSCQLLGGIIILLFAAAVTSFLVPEKIVGGQDVDIVKFPWMVSLQADKDCKISHFCGGCVFSKNFVITAAHCVDKDFDALQAFIQVRAGSSAYTHGGSVHRVVNIIKHHEYREDGNHHDIALIKVSPEFKFSDKVQAISLNSGTKLPENTEVDVIGWGDFHENNTETPVNLQHVKMSIIGCDELKFICATSLHGSAGICNGDSGGPMSYNDVLFGVSAWSVVCGDEGKRTGFIDVSLYGDWVSSMTSEECEYNFFRFDFNILSAVLSVVCLLVVVCAYVLYKCKYCCGRPIHGFNDY